jgi:hypothetical protein
LKEGSRGECLGPIKNDNRERGRLHNEELHRLYSSPNIIRVNKSRGLR